MWLGMPGWPDGGCAAGLGRGSSACGYGAAWGAVPGPPALPSFQAGSSSRQPSSELAEGRGLLTLTNAFHPRRRRALPLAAGVCPRQSCGLRSHLLARVKAPGSDVSVPGDAAGNDRVDLADQRRGDRGAGLLVGEPVFSTAGHARVPGGVDRVVAQRAPDRAPGGQPQRGPAAAGDAGAGRCGCRWSSPMVPGRRA